MLWTYDFEVSAFDWLVVFKRREDGEYTVIHNDNDALTNFINETDVYCGFNSKHYDQFIAKGIAFGFTPQEVKALNDYLIAGGRGWDYPALKTGGWFRFNNIDIRDDTQLGLSLKAIEAHLGLSIRETTVSFDLDRPWTPAELDEMIFYCKHDVDATEKLITVRKEYLKTKTYLGKLAGIPPEQAMAMTNAKLTAAFLQAQPPAAPWTDERQYVIPDNLKREYIPQEVFDYFARMYDPTLTDDDVFGEKLEISVGGTPTVIGYGGIHAAIPNYVWRENDGQENP